jgi:hypothetical protein
VDADRADDYIALVVRLQSAADGTWHISVDGTTATTAIPLVPVTLIVRLWRSESGGLLRGRIGLEGSDRWAPFQSNMQLEELVREWLLPGSAPNE